MGGRYAQPLQAGRLAAGPSLPMVHCAHWLLPQPPPPHENEVLITRYMRCSCFPQKIHSTPPPYSSLLSHSCLSPFPAIFCSVISLTQFFSKLNSFVTIATAFVANREANICFFVLLFFSPFQGLFSLCTIAGDPSMLERETSTSYEKRYCLHAVFKILRHARGNTCDL